MYSSIVINITTDLCTYKQIFFLSHRLLLLIFYVRKCLSEVTQIRDKLATLGQLTVQLAASFMDGAKNAVQNVGDYNDCIYTRKAQSIVV